MIDEMYDISILGCGPAGLSAAVNALIRNKRIIVLGDDVCSPPLHKAQKINNYLGFAEMNGEELLGKFLEHARSMQVKIRHSKVELITIDEDGTFNLLVDGEVLKSRSVVIATGIPYKPTIPREDDYLGKGLGYCATCDGPIYRDKDVIIVSHDAEGEIEAKYMAEICRKVYYLPLYKEMGTIDSRIETILDKPAEIIGNGSVKGLLLKSGRKVSTDGLFILGGETAPDRIIPGLEIVDNHINVGRDQATNLPGVFAAGDCTGKPYQVAKSVGEGQIAGLNASKYAGSTH